MINRFFWQEILNEAKRRGVPKEKKRAILREFLQVKYLTLLYSYKDCQKLAFIGGTSLRLLRGLDRFSEDLDFDNFGLTANQAKTLFEKATGEFKREDYNFEFDFRKTKIGGIARLRFSGLLNLLEMGSNLKEKLMLRIDYTNQPRIETEVLLLSRFGESERIVTNTLPVLLAQKAKALFSRKQTQGRDFYDIYWLLCRKVEPNTAILKNYGIESINDFYQKLEQVYAREKKNLPDYKRKLKPFLLQEKNIRYLDFFKDLVSGRIDGR